MFIYLHSAVFLETVQGRLVDNMTDVTPMKRHSRKTRHGTQGLNIRALHRALVRALIGVIGRAIGF
jgi:hypothetical protein